MTRVSPKILLQLATDDPTLTLSDASVLATIQGWCDAASETINGWLGTRYVTPVASPPASPAAEFAKLVNWEADIAAYNGYTYRSVEDANNPWKARHDSITSKNEGILMRVAAGTMNLTGCALQSVPSDSKSPVRSGFSSERPHFNPPPLWGGDPFGKW
jgi:phage gp36-like protein